MGIANNPPGVPGSDAPVQGLDPRIAMLRRISEQQQAQQAMQSGARPATINPGWSNPSSSGWSSPSSSGWSSGANAAPWSAPAPAPTLTSPPPAPGPRVALVRKFGLNR